jgi:two-component system, NtrC family, sensor kinase
VSTDPAPAPAGQDAVPGEDVEALLAEREDLREKLVQQEKLASLGGMAAGIAHEIKNPLHFVQNFAEAVAELANELGAIVDDARERMPTDTIEDLETLQAELGDAAAKIVEHGNRVDGIVKSMLLYPWGTSVERHLTDVNALARESATVAYHGLRARKVISPAVALEFELSDRLVPVAVAPHSLSRAVSNLVANACEAAQEAATDDHLPTVRVVTRRTDDGFELTVSDNGPGIGGVDHARVFEPFFTTKKALENIGLGLSQVWDITTRDHAGQVDVETSDAGTTITLTIPIEEGDE